MARLGDVTVEVEERLIAAVPGVPTPSPAGTLRTRCWNAGHIASGGSLAAARLDRGRGRVWLLTYEGALTALHPKTGKTLESWRVGPASAFIWMHEDGQISWRRSLESPGRPIRGGAVWVVFDPDTGRLRSHTAIWRDSVGVRHSMAVFRIETDAVVWATHDVLAKVDPQTGAVRSLRRRVKRDRAHKVGLTVEEGIDLPLLRGGPVTRVAWLVDGSALTQVESGRKRGWSATGESKADDEAVEFETGSVGPRGYICETRGSYQETQPYMGETTAIVSVRGSDGEALWTLERAQNEGLRAGWWNADVLWVGWARGPELHDAETGAVLGAGAPDVGEAWLLPSAGLALSCAGGLRVRELPSLAELSVFEGPADQLLDARPDGGLVLTVAVDEIALWTPSDGLLGTARFAGDPVVSGAVHPTRPIALVGTRDGRVHLVEWAS